MQGRRVAIHRLLIFVLVLAAIATLVSRTSHAQGQCPTRFQEQTSGLVTDQGMVCQTAVNKKCVFQMSLCVNEAEAGCTAKNLKHKDIRASSLCKGAGKVHVKASGTSPVCGGFSGVTVRTKKHGTKAGSCKISGKAGKAKTKITLLCEPQAGLCPSTTTTTTSTTLVCVTTTTLPRCGNGVVEAGEACDPPCSQGQCGAGEFCNSSCQCVATAACACGGTAPTKLNFTTAVGAGNCGAVADSTGSNLLCLSCAGLYFGGGAEAVPLPALVPDMGSSLTKVTCSDTCLTLAATTQADVGGTNPERHCTSVGCLFGPPLPIPNSAAAALSTCVINTVAQDAQGFGQCTTGASSISLPLTSSIYLFGDLLNGTTADRPDVPGTQPCPVCRNACLACSSPSGPTSTPCTSNADCGSGGFCGVGACTTDADCAAGIHCSSTPQCLGGPNDGLACTPGSGSLGDPYPTSHDCPPPMPPGQPIGSLPIPFALTTGISSKTGVASGTQQHVFCGFCRDAANTGCFEGDPANGCPHNNPNSTCTAAMTPLACCTGAGTGTCVACTGAGAPFPCCTGAGTGTCDPQAMKTCTSNTDCTDGNGSWADCEQRNQGAFHQGGAAGVFEVGAPAGDITDGGSHASTLVSVFCIPPTFNGAVDAAADLPGPGAVSLPGQAQLVP